MFSVGGNQLIVTALLAVGVSELEAACDGAAVLAGPEPPPPQPESANPSAAAAQR